MKKLLFTLTLGVLIHFAHAQAVVGEYSLDYFGETYSVRAGETKKGKMSVYIQVKGDGVDEMYLNIEEKDLSRFKQALVEMRDKYVEWSQTAIENDVAKLTKQMDIKFPKVTVRWDTPSRIHLSINNDLSPVFSILENGDHLAIIASKVKSSFNRFIEETFYFVISDPSEVDELLSVLDIDKITQVVNQNQELLDLFN